MKSFVLFLLLNCAFFYTMNAQTVGGGLVLAFPQGEFKNNVDNMGWGFNINATLTAPGKLKPFAIGLNLNYINYGSESETRPFSYTNPDVYVDVNRTNNIVNFHLLGLISPFTGTVRPYGEILLGGAYIYTTTEIKSEYDNERIAESTNIDDWAWSYGGSAGILIKIQGETAGMMGLYLDLKGTYLKGSEAIYLAEGDVVVNKSVGTVRYYPRKSDTDIFSIMIGVKAFLF